MPTLQEISAAAYALSALNKLRGNEIPANVLLADASAALLAAERARKWQRTRGSTLNFWRARSGTPARPTIHTMLAEDIAEARHHHDQEAEKELLAVDLLDEASE